MPKIVSDLLDSELPNTDKITVNTDKKDESKNLNIYDLIQKQSSNKKEQVGVTLNKEIVDKLKTVCVDSNMTMSRMFENLLTPFLSDVEINYDNVKIYNDKNKAKGRRVKSK